MRPNFFCVLSSMGHADSFCKKESCSQASLLFEDTVWSRISASFLATWSLTARGIPGITLQLSQPGLRTSKNGGRPFPILDVGGRRGGDGGDVTAGIKPGPGHLEATGPCTLTLPSLLMGISLAHEEQVPLLERKSSDIALNNCSKERLKRN